MQAVGFTCLFSSTLVLAALFSLAISVVPTFFHPAVNCESLLQQVLCLTGQDAASAFSCNLDFSQELTSSILFTIEQDSVLLSPHPTWSPIYMWLLPDNQLHTTKLLCLFKRIFSHLAGLLNWSETLHQNDMKRQKLMSYTVALKLTDIYFQR